jgi:hypothetical protein
MITNSMAALYQTPLTAWILMRGSIVGNFPAERSQAEKRLFTERTCAWKGRRRGDLLMHLIADRLGGDQQTSMGKVEN